MSQTKNADVVALNAYTQMTGVGINEGGTKFVVTYTGTTQAISGSDITIVLNFVDNNSSATDKNIVISQNFTTPSANSIAKDDSFTFDGFYFSDLETPTTQPNFDGDVTAVIYYTPGA